MRLEAQCKECLLTRISLECSLCGVSGPDQDKVLAECQKLLETFSSISLPHPQIASAVHRCACRMMGCDDPFREVKKRGNLEASVVAETIPQDAGFRDLVLASIIGNTYDYGVRGHEVPEDFATFFRSEVKNGLFIDDTAEMPPLFGRIVYLTDNCGEVVLDRLVLQYLRKQGSKILLVVRNGPILNDATIREAEELGLDQICDQVCTGGAENELGVRFDLIPEPVREEMERATLIISKGMANYESLREYSHLPPVAYLLAAKCHPVAVDLGVPRGSKVALLRR